MVRRRPGEGKDGGTPGAGGLIRIQTKRGGQSDAPLLDPERCEIPGWKGEPQEDTPPPGPPGP